MFSFIRHISDSARRRMGRFDSHGLRHSKRYLEEVRYDIAFYSLSAQSFFADAVTVKNVGNADFLSFSVAGLYSGSPRFEDFDATTVGNLAFIALNATSKAVRTRAMDILEGYKSYVRNKNLLIRK